MQQGKIRCQHYRNHQRRTHRQRHRNHQHQTPVGQKRPAGKPCRLEPAIRDELVSRACRPHGVRVTRADQYQGQGPRHGRTGVTVARMRLGTRMERRVSFPAEPTSETNQRNHGGPPTPADRDDRPTVKTDRDDSSPTPTTRQAAHRRHDSPPTPDDRHNRPTARRTGDGAASSAGHGPPALACLGSGTAGATPAQTGSKRSGEAAKPTGMTLVEGPTKRSPPLSTPRGAAVSVWPGVQLSGMFDRGGDRAGAGAVADILHGSAPKTTEQAGITTEQAGIATGPAGRTAGRSGWFSRRCRSGWARCWCRSRRRGNRKWCSFRLRERRSRTRCGRSPWFRCWSPWRPRRW